MRPFDLSLYLVTDRNPSLHFPLEKIVEEAVEGGVTMVQLREKDCTSREFYEIALRLKRILHRHAVPFIINDRVDIALACDADGLHIGQSDLPYPVVRTLLGKEKIIGLSVENVQDALVANSYDVDYIAFSPVFGTPTKTNTACPLGLEGVREISAISDHPGVGIGGLHAANIRDVLEAGADGIAVVSAIMSSPDPRQSAMQLSNLIKNL